MPTEKEEGLEQLLRGAASEQAKFVQDVDALLDEIALAAGFDNLGGDTNKLVQHIRDMRAERSPVEEVTKKFFDVEVMVELTVEAESAAEAQNRATTLVHEALEDEYDNDATRVDSVYNLSVEEA